VPSPTSLLLCFPPVCVFSASRNRCFSPPFLCSRSYHEGGERETNQRLEAASSGAQAVLRPGSFFRGGRLGFRCCEFQFPAVCRGDRKAAAKAGRGCACSSEEVLWVWYPAVTQIEVFLVNAFVLWLWVVLVRACLAS
ncbi:hypothetical protein EJB05_33384, partial [Eragrostis curvula]